MDSMNMKAIKKSMLIASYLFILYVGFMMATSTDPQVNFVIKFLGLGLWFWFFGNIYKDYI